MSEQLPPFLTDALKKQYSEEIYEKILRGYHAHRAVTLRVNTLKSDAARIDAALSAAGLAHRISDFYADAFILPDAQERDVWALPAYENGEIYLQSLSSMLPPIALCPREKADILDMAAAPGGKTTQMAAMTGNMANISACEVNKIRADKLKYNLDKQGARRVNVMVRDASKLEDFFRFDQILLDAPCSGSGTLLFENPNGLRAFSEKLVRNSARLQAALLKKALTMLKAGGEMVYSTCSVLTMENEDVVTAALKGVKAEIVPIEMHGMEALPLLPSKLAGTLLVAPNALYEGFFVAKIRKNA